MSGVFAAVSLAFFSMVFYFTTPEVERFVNFLRNKDIWGWVRQSFLEWDALWMSVGLLFATLGASFFGLASGIAAKVLHDQARDVFKSGIVE